MRRYIVPILSYNLTGYMLIGTSGLGIIVAIVFLIGTRNLAGWGTNFSYWILRSIAFCTLITCVPTFYGFIISVATPGWDDPLSLRWRIVGSAILLPYITVILLNFVLTLHRTLVTCFPLNHFEYFSERAAKITFGTIWSCHVLLFLYFVFSPIAILGYSKSSLHYITNDGYGGTKFAKLFTKSLEYFNYIFGIFNLIVYPFVFVNLYKRGSLSFKSSAEFRMTFQISLSVLIELCFFVYWEIVPYQYLSVPFQIMDLTSDMAYSFLMLMPYLLLNANMKKNLFRCCQNVSIQPLEFDVSSNLPK